MSDQKHLTLPILGMTCANCVATVERNLKRVDGVEAANVNLASERAAVTYDPDKANLDDFIKRVQGAGYQVAIGEASLGIKNLTDASDVLRLDKVLNAQEGVIEAQVSLATERALIKYVPTVISQNELRQLIRSSGFDLLETDRPLEDAEASARKQDIAQQKRLLWIGLIFMYSVYPLDEPRFRAITHVFRPCPMDELPLLGFSDSGSILCGLAIFCQRL